MTNADTNTWILGLDLGDRSVGAVRFAHWLAGPDHTIAVHVLEMWSRPYIRTDAISAVHNVVKRLSHELHIPQPARVTVLDADSAEEGLALAAEGAAGLVIGRAAGLRDDVEWRLGHVARRVLRQLPGPVIVVPRDLQAIAPGPILLATDCQAPSRAAASFARDLAAKHGRELVVMHVGETRYSELIDDLEPRWQAARVSHREEIERALQDWMTEHKLGAHRHHLVFGSTVDEIQTFAAATQAAVIVVGSRRLGTVGRVFLGSTASVLSGRAACPVAVIPPN